MSRVQKTYEIASFKAFPANGDGGGKFEAIVSVFDNVDYQGDRMMPGSFTKSIEKWNTSGDPVPIIWSHSWGDPFAHIGKVLAEDLAEVEATDEHPAGLYVKGQLDIDKPFAKQVYDLLKERRVKEFSFAYDVIGEQTATDGANNVTEVDLIEVGPTLKGANPDTVSLGVKAQLDRAAHVQVSSEILAAAMVLDPELAKSLGAQMEDDEETDVDDAFVKALDALGLIATEEKAVTKPWHVSESDGEFCVYKDGEEEPLKCYSNEEDALAYLRALYANEPEKSEDPDTDTKSEDPDEEKSVVGQKAGKVIGAAAAAALKERLAEAVDTFVGEVNGTATPDEELPDEDMPMASEEPEGAKAEEAPDPEKSLPDSEDAELFARVEDLAMELGMVDAQKHEDPPPTTDEQLQAQLDDITQE